VSARYVFGVPSTVTQEVARVLFLWMAMIGGAYVFGLGRHLAFDFLPHMFKGSRRAALECAILASLILFAVLVLIWGGGSLTLRTFATGQVLPTIGISQGWVYLSVPLSGAIMLYYAIDDVIRILRLGPEAVRLGSGDDSMT